MAPPHITGAATPRSGLPYHDRIGFQLPHGRRTKTQERLEAQRQANPMRSRLTDEAHWKRMTEKKWAPAKEKIEQLYCHEKLPLRLVMDIMWCIYQVGVQGNGQYLDRLGKWCHFKNYPVTKPDNADRVRDDSETIDDGDANTAGKQTRAQRKPKPSLQIQRNVISPHEFDFNLHASAPPPSVSSLSPNRYRPHEGVLVSVDRFIHGIFGSRKEKWSTNITGFLDSNGRQCPLTKIWRTLPERCYGASILIRCQMNIKAETNIQRMLDDLRKICHLEHPAFIVYFWRLCLRLHSIDSHLPFMKPLDRLFALLLECWPDRSNHIGLLISSLREVGNDELRHVLRIGYVKAIRTLTELIGDENIMVLEMVSFYYRFFSAKFILKQALIAKFQSVWHQIHTPGGLGVDMWGGKDDRYIPPLASCHRQAAKTGSGAKE
ncbi:hypothetical protein B0T14DRAFT_591393 [Immersiella caudata]|uniref:Clr5 domain-containing protein n=1 Tax=Immersiella caudata TaxID=314043 RepID=A0AA40BTX9_9PEZI|nr:hypothetical protein B0T14DRAFT_591393 [Immersiella caudata]